MLYPRQIVSLLFAAFLFSTAGASEWSTWRGDATRSGSSEDVLSGKLKIAWVHRAQHSPAPAIQKPRSVAKTGGMGNMMVPCTTDDYSFQLVAANGSLYFGSSSEESITCLDTLTGKTRWVFYAEGAVRFAPVLENGKVYFGSDDGFVYCVDGANGALLWKFQAAPSTRRIIASQRISSQWPVRGGLTLQNGIVYAACGIFPEEDRGVLLYALDATDGTLRYKEPLSIHAMGHLLTDGDTLVIPAGRAAPLDVLAATGKRAGGYTFTARRAEGGGSPYLVADMLIYGPNENGVLKIRASREKAIGVREEKIRVPGHIAGLKGWRMVADSAHIYVLRNEAVLALDREPFIEALTLSAKEGAKRAKERKVYIKRHQQVHEEPVLVEDIERCTKWSAANEINAVSMIRVGKQIIIGGQNTIQAFNAADGSPAWSVQTDGVVWDLAAADGAVFASTDQGQVVCLRSDGKQTPAATIKPDAPFQDQQQSAYNDHAKQILAKTDTQQGYCLIAGVETGRLIYEIAQQSDLFVLGLESDPKKIDAARKLLTDAGLYGERVSIHQADFNDLNYLGGFANIVLSETAFDTGTLPCSAGKLLPMLQPSGGLLALGGKADLAQGAQLPNWKTDNGIGFFIRPELAGSGEWTHMFADPANTLCSDDQLVKGTKYDIQWIGPPGTERQFGWHDNSMTDLFKDAKLYLIRSDYVMALDAYNGTELWGLDVPGSLRLGVSHESGQACVDSDFLYVAATNDCWLIDVNSGEKARAYTTPDPTQDWGYLAIVGDQLYGSQQSPKATYNIQSVAAGHQWKRPKKGERIRQRSAWGVMQNTQVMSTRLFSLAKKNGKKLWEYAAASQILNSSITLGDGTLFFLENRNPDLPGQDVGMIFLDEFFASDSFLVALDAKTGAKKWDIPFTSKAEEILYLSYAKGTLLCVASANKPFAESEETDENKNYYELTALNAKNGATQWSRSIVAGSESYAHNVNIQPALIMGDQVYLSMRTGGRLFTFNLSDGKGEEIPGFRGSKGCGVMTGSATTLFFRNMVSEGYDTVSKKTFFTSSINRPSCWLNGLPAGGLMLMPEATTGCDCTFALQISIVLAPQL